MTPAMPGADSSSLQSQLAALEQLLAVQEQAVLKQSDRLEAALAQMEGILQTASDAIIAIDESQRVILFNKQAEVLFGYQASEIMGRPLDQLLPTRFRAAHAGHIERFAAEPVMRRLMSERPELRGLRKNGEEFVIEVTIAKLDMGIKQLFTAVVRDVTERQQREDHTRQEQEALTRMNETMMGREERVLELKREVNELLGVLNQPPRYNV
jgi:PAS domain S-box-containing protein